MKFGTLKSIGHNVADSAASGVGMMIGVYDMDVFGEARRSPEGFIEVDLLTGEVSGGKVSEELAHSFRLYARELPHLCKRHRADVSDFNRLSARFSGRPMFEQFAVTVEDRHGRRSTDEYVGVPGKRKKVLDHLGRVRGT